MHTELTRLVGGGRDHTAFITLPTHHNRLPFQGRVEQFFDRDEEGVHVDMKNGAALGVGLGILHAGHAGLCPYSTSLQIAGEAQKMHNTGYSESRRIPGCYLSPSEAGFF